jgi:hypothetical protein
MASELSSHVMSHAEVDAFHETMPPHSVDAEYTLHMLCTTGLAIAPGYDFIVESLEMIIRGDKTPSELFKDRIHEYDCVVHLHGDRCLKVYVPIGDMFTGHFVELRTVDADPYGSVWIMTPDDQPDYDVESSFESFDDFIKHVDLCVRGG